MGIENARIGLGDNLAARRPIFHSEADFQLALAWQLQVDYPETGLRLEKRVIERPRDVEIDGEGFVLQTGSATGSSSRCSRGLADR